MAWHCRSLDRRDGNLLSHHQTFQWRGAIPRFNVDGGEHHCSASPELQEAGELDPVDRLGCDLHLPLRLQKPHFHRRVVRPTVDLGYYGADRLAADLQEARAHLSTRNLRQRSFSAAGPLVEALATCLSSS